ncbi:MAG TPA: proline racemase family protein, partial [Paenirhodobacter sp.]
EIVVDVAYGGNFYAIVEPQKNFRDMADFTAGELIGFSPKLRKALNEKYEFVHPEHPAINGLSHIQWTGKATVADAHARNAVFYGDKAIDRSPCGTGTSARMAQLTAKGKLKVGDEFWHESIIGSIFKGRVEAAVEVAGHPAINGLSHIQWTGAPTVPGAHGRNAVFYGDKAIDRSPCGTGTSARMAQLAAKGRLQVGDDFWHESIIGSIFKGRVEAAVQVAGRPAIIPSIAGWARMTGYNTIFIDDRDPFAHGFVVK